MESSVPPTRVPRVPKVPLIILIKVDDQPEFDRELSAMVRIKFDTSDEKIITITKHRALVMGRIGLSHEDKILAIGINRIRKRDNTPERIEAIYYIQPYPVSSVIINNNNGHLNDPVNPNICNGNNPVNPGPVNQNGGKKHKTRRRPTRK